MFKNKINLGVSNTKAADRILREIKPYEILVQSCKHLFVLHSKSVRSNELLVKAPSNIQNWVIC